VLDGRTVAAVRLNYNKYRNIKISREKLNLFRFYRRGCDTVEIQAHCFNYLKPEIHRFNTLKFRTCPTEARGSVVG
jgi:hypothetical protein